MALGFNGSTDKLRRTTNLPTNTAFTMMGWFYIAVDRNAFTAFLDYGNTGASPDKTLQTTADGTTLQVYDGTDSVTGTNLQVGKWYHLAMTYDAASARAYVNGVLDITNPGLSAPGTAISIGNDGSSEFLNGYAAGIKIYNAVLTAPEIQAEMPYYMPVRLPSLNSVYPLRNLSDIFSVAGMGASVMLTVTGTLDNVPGPPNVTWAPTRRVYRDVPAALGGGSFKPFWAAGASQIISWGGHGS